MAADESHDVTGNTTTINWWIQFVGLKDDKLFICFRNGDCATYQMPLAAAQMHLAAILASPHPGLYVNINLHRAGEPYVKAACPAGQISAATFAAQATCPGPTVRTALAADTTVIYNVINLTPSAAWFRAFIPAFPKFEVLWIDPNPGFQNIEFFNNPADTSCTGKVSLGLDNTGTFTDFTAGALDEIIMEYQNIGNHTLPIQFRIIGKL